MGNGISFNTDSGFTALVGDLRLDQILGRELALRLTDTANLRNSGFLTYAGSINNSSSDTIRVAIAGLDGRDLFETVSGEADAATNQALTQGHADIVASRLVLQYKMTDLASLTNSAGANLDPFRLAQSMAGSYDATFMQKTAAAAANFSNSVGSNTTTFSVDDFFSGIYKLERADSERGASGPFYAVMHSKALSELQDSLRNETGNALSWSPATQEMLAIKGPGFAGSMMGVAVYKSSHVNANGSSGYDSWIASPGAIGYCDGSPGALPGAGLTVQSGPVLVEFERDGAKAVTLVLGHAYLGCGIIDQNRGSLMLSAQ
jgi:hypothetical protein